MEPKIDNIAKRVMSARRLKINELKNTNEELIQQIRDLKDENKLLKKTQFRTEKALQRFEDKESDLPQIMQRQQNEVRSLKDQIRKWREKHDKTDRYLRDAEDELEKVKFKLKKLKSVTEEKGLPERSELNKRLTQAELEIEERDVKIKVGVSIHQKTWLSGDSLVKIAENIPIDQKAWLSGDFACKNRGNYPIHQKT